MLNNLTIFGRITADPEEHISANGKRFATFAIACDRDFDRDITDFFDCIAFGKTADLILRYFPRGRAILIQGHLQTNRWTDGNGKKRKDVKIICDQVYFTSSKKDEQAKARQKYQDSQQDSQPQNPDFMPDYPDDYTDYSGDVPFNEPSPPTTL